MDKAQDYYGNDEKCMWCDKQLYWDYEGEDRMVVGINGDSITAVPITICINKDCEDGLPEFKVQVRLKLALPDIVLVIKYKEDYG